MDSRASRRVLREDRSEEEPGGDDGDVRKCPVEEVDLSSPDMSGSTMLDARLTADVGSAVFLTLWLCSSFVLQQELPRATAGEATANERASERTIDSERQLGHEVGRRGRQGPSDRGTKEDVRRRRGRESV